MKTKAALIAMTALAAAVISAPAHAQEGAVENISMSVGCRDTGEITHQLCFPYRATKLDVQIYPPMTGAAEVTGQQIDPGGCVTVKMAVSGERRLSPEHPGSFQSRQSKAPDPLQVPQCLPTGASAIVRVRY